MHERDNWTCIIQARSIEITPSKSACYCTIDGQTGTKNKHIVHLNKHGQISLSKLAFQQIYI